MIFIRYHQLVNWLIRKIWQDLNNNKEKKFANFLLNRHEKRRGCADIVRKFFLEFYEFYKWIFWIVENYSALFQKNL